MDIRWFFLTMFLEMVISVWFIESSENATTSVECEKDCCDGYYRISEEENCIKCSAGYSGRNCTIKCPYPTYGDGCQGLCGCDNETCDASTGCRLLTTDDLTSFSPTTEPITEYNNTTFYTTDYSSSTVSETYKGATSFNINSILIILIKIFGGVDILLILTYAVIFVVDRQREKCAYQTETTPSYVTRNNAMYENIETYFFT